MMFNLTWCALPVLSRPGPPTTLSFSSLVPPPNRAYLRTLIHNADLEHLEKVVLDGHGQVSYLVTIVTSHLITIL